MKITVVQPAYYAGDKPDETIAQFLLEQMESVEPGALMVLPEYSNAGGLSDPDLELQALSRAGKMLSDASRLRRWYGAK